MVSGSPSVVNNSSLSFADIAPGNNALYMSDFCSVLTIELESTRSLAQYRVHALACSNIEYLTKNKMT